MPTQSPQIQPSVIEWLLDSDPAIRCQVMRDLLDAPASSEAVAAERAKVATEGWGARLEVVHIRQLITRSAFSKGRHSNGYNSEKECLAAVWSRSRHAR